MSTQTLIRPPLFERLAPRGEGVLTDLHKEIVKTVFEFRFINSEMLCLLFLDRLQPPRDKKRKPAGRQIDRIARTLYDFGYLERPKEQKIWRLQGEGSRKLVYGLGNKGADLLAREFGISRGKLDWQDKSYVQTLHLDHTLMISQLHAALLLAVKSHHDVQLIDWRQDRGIKAYVQIAETIKRWGKEYERQRTVRVIPDAFFTILKPNGKRAHFFLEAAHTTPNQSHLKKLKAYWQFWKEGKHTELLDIKTMRVLTIAKSKEKTERLRQLAKKADPRGEGSPMFLFLWEGEIDLHQPQKMFESIWRSPTNDMPVSIIE